MCEHEEPGQVVSTQSIESASCATSVRSTCHSICRYLGRYLGSFSAMVKESCQILDLDLNKGWPRQKGPGTRTKGKGQGSRCSADTAGATQHTCSR
jgi:hypothetical protein